MNAFNQKTTAFLLKHAATIRTLTIIAIIVLFAISFALLNQPTANGWATGGSY